MNEGLPFQTVPDPLLYSFIPLFTMVRKKSNLVLTPGLKGCDPLGQLRAVPFEILRGSSKNAIQSVQYTLNVYNV